MSSPSDVSAFSCLVSNHAVNIPQQLPNQNTQKLLLPRSRSSLSEPIQQSRHLPSSRNPLEIFVGSLSYFCDEQSLFNLFNQYSTVSNVRIMRSDDKSRSLKFGFVIVANRKEVEEVCRLMNGHLFMGRQMRVEPSDTTTSMTPNTATSNQIHVALASTFSTNQIIKPTETLLRKFFMKFGSIIDVQVNWYTTGSAMSNRQEGYAFVRFAKEDTFHTVLANPNYIVDGITLICTQSNGGSGTGRHRSYTSSTKSSAPTFPLNHSRHFLYSHQYQHSVPSMNVLPLPPSLAIPLPSLSTRNNGLSDSTTENDYPMLSVPYGHYI